jgi:PAS domain S-box-containing protein
VLSRQAPDQSTVLSISNEVALVCDASGVIQWTDARAERLLAVHVGDAFASLAQVGSQDKARRLLEAACVARSDMWELVMHAEGRFTIMAWRGTPVPGGALLVGSLLPQHYAHLHDELSAVLSDLATLQRETERQRKRLASLQAQNEALLVAERNARSLVEVERNRLQQVVDGLPEGIIIADSNGHYVLANAAATELLGVELTGVSMPKPDEILAFGARSLDGEPIPARHLAAHRSAVYGEIIRGEQLVIRNASDGRDVPLLVNSVPLRGSDGELVGAVAVFQDISAIKELEQQKDNFLATVSHDLRNPLAGIKGWIQILRNRARRLPEDHREKWQQDLGTVEMATNRMSAIIDELTDLTQMQMGRQLELHRTDVDLFEVVHRVLAEHQQLAQKHNVRVHPLEEHCVGSWDPTRLGRVIGNLISNAIKYSPDGGDIDVEVSRERSGGVDWAVLSVRDQGIGIPEQDLPRVFERFFRARNAETKFAGTAIGLAGARQLVDQHGGTIEVRSQTGVGSTFIVRLPLTLEPQG